MSVMIDEGVSSVLMPAARKAGGGEFRLVALVILMLPLRLHLIEPYLPRSCFQAQPRSTPRERWFMPLVRKLTAIVLPPANGLPGRAPGKVTPLAAAALAASMLALAWQAALQFALAAWLPMFDVLMMRP